MKLALRLINEIKNDSVSLKVIFNYGAHNSWTSETY